jgi:hypothetical protein
MQLGSHQMAAPRRISSFDFPSPPIPVPNRRMTGTFGEPGSISGGAPVVSLISHPSLGASHECLPQPIRRSQTGAMRRWSTLPSEAFHPDNRWGPTELVTNRSTELFPRMPSPSIPGDAGSDMPSSPIRRSRRQEPSDTFTSFMDMSVNKPTLSKSRVYHFFSRVSGRLKSRSKRH